MQPRPLGTGAMAPPGVPSSVPGSMRSGLEPNTSPHMVSRPVTSASLLPPESTSELSNADMNNTVSSVTSAASKQQDRSSAGSLQVRKIQMMVEQELAMSTSALHEQFRQQLEIERSDRQAALADIRQDIKAIQSTLSSVEKTTAQAPSAAAAAVADSTLLDLRGQVASLRDDVRGSLARQDSIVGDYESVHRELEGIQTLIKELRSQAGEQSAMLAIEQQQLSTAQLREDVLALAQRLVVVEQGAAEAATAAAAAAMARVDTSQLLTAVRLEIAQPMEAEMQREIDSVKKQALDRIDDVAASFESVTKTQRSATEELKKIVSDGGKLGNAARDAEKVRLEDLQSALEAEHEARRAAVDELRASITEAWGAAARSAQTTNEASGRLRELSDEIAIEKRLREVSLEDLSKRLPPAGEVSIKSEDLAKITSGSTGLGATNARIDELVRGLENEKQLRSAEVEDLLSRIMHLSAKSAATGSPAAGASPETLTTLASNADVAASKVDSIRLRNEVLEELRVEFGGRVRAMIAEQSADLRAELVARIEAIESHLWRAKVDEALREKMEEVLRLTRMVIGQSEKLQEQVVQETATRKAGETKLSTRMDRLERSLIEKGMKGTLPTNLPQADFTGASVSSAGHMSNVTPTTGTVISEEEPLEDPVASDPAAGFISSALRNTLEELVDKVQKTLRPGSMDRADDHASTEATPSEGSNTLNTTGEGFEAITRQNVLRMATPSQSLDRGDRSSSRNPFNYPTARAASREVMRTRSPMSQSRMSNQLPQDITKVPESPRPGEGRMMSPMPDAGSMNRVASRDGTIQDGGSMSFNVGGPESIADGGQGRQQDIAAQVRNAVAAGLAGGGAGSMRLPQPHDPTLRPPNTGGSTTLPVSQPMNRSQMGASAKMSPSPRTSSAARGQPSTLRDLSLEANSRGGSIGTRQGMAMQTAPAAGASANVPVSNSAVRQTSLQAAGMGRAAAKSPPPQTGSPVIAGVAVSGGPRPTQQVSPLSPQSGARPAKQMYPGMTAPRR